MRTNLVACRDVDGDVYRNLVRFAQFEKHTFSLVQRDKMKLQAPGREILEALLPCLLAEQRVAEWPGTDLGAVRATLRRYKLNAKSADVLLSATDSLFGWTQPSLPEDLALWNKSDEWWLATIAHERDAFVRADQMNMEKLAKAVPGLLPAEMQ
jgi:hypothetical protein